MLDKDTHNISWLMEQIDVDSVLDKLNIKAKRRGDEYWGLCPDHHLFVGREPSHPKWSLNARTGFTYCFTESRGSNLLWITTRLRSSTTHEAMSWLLGDVADSASVLLEHLVRCLNNLVPSKEIETFDADRFSYQLKNAELGLQSVIFLAKHCIKAETAREFGCVEFSAGFYRDRLIFPVIDDEQQTVGFVATDVLGKDEWLRKNPKLVDSETKELRPTTLSDYKKVLYPRNFKVGNYLVGMHSFKKNDTAILVEGCRDVMKLRQEGFSGTLGLGSANITDNQLQSLSRLVPKKIIVMLDGDTVGRQNGVKMTARCCRFFDQVFMVQLSDGRDPKDLMRSEVLFHLKHKTEQVRL